MATYLQPKAQDGSDPWLSPTTTSSGTSNGIRTSTNSSSETETEKKGQRVVFIFIHFLEIVGCSCEEFVIGDVVMLPIVLLS